MMTPETVTTDVMELFARVRAGMEAQNWRQAGGNKSPCYYRLPSDPTVGCAIGVLLPDGCETLETEYGSSLYAFHEMQSMDGDTAHRQAQLMIDAKLDESLRNVAKAIQFLHDTFDAIEWRQRFDALERKFREGVYTLELMKTNWRVDEIFPRGD